MSEVKIKNKELGSIKLQITGLDSNSGQQMPGVGLLLEKFSIGTKNMLQKIDRAIAEHLKDYSASHLELIKKHGGKENKKTKAWAIIGELPEAFNTEFKELSEQEVTLQIDLLDFTRIENVETAINYDWELLGKFFFNYQ